MIDVERERGYIITGNDISCRTSVLGDGAGSATNLCACFAGDPSEQDRLATRPRLDAKVAVSQANAGAQTCLRRHARVLEGAESANEFVGNPGDIKAQSERRNELRSQRDAMMDELRQHIIVAVLFAPISYPFLPVAYGGSDV